MQGNIKQLGNLERIIYMFDDTSDGGVCTNTHLWSGDFRFQFVPVEPRRVL
jgi:hypothetical protein